MKVAVGVNPACDNPLFVRHNLPALLEHPSGLGTTGRDETDSALKALEARLLSGHVLSDRLVRVPPDTGRQIVCKARSQRNTESHPHLPETQPV